MLSSSLDTLLKVSKTTSPKKLFAYNCVTLYVYFSILQIVYRKAQVDPFYPNLEYFITNLYAGRERGHIGPLGTKLRIFLQRHDFRENIFLKSTIFHLLSFTRNCSIMIITLYFFSR